MNITEKPVILELKHIKKTFDQEQVLNGICLRIHEGEFITLLGSSGCGKTTTLRIIAGLEMPDEGEVILNGEVVNAKAPEKRNVNTVFQNYALFPHMNVEQNIGYGLKIEGVPKAEIKERVTKMLSLVQLEGFEKRMPMQMSGGQRQRVAIARALIKNPKVLLLDEPLGALDLQLRRQMQLELKQLQKKLGITFIYITHDQEEAINMSDRIAVMRNGHFEQIGTPAEIYDEPATAYVASFVGNANLCSGTLTEITEQDMILTTMSGTMPCRLSANASHLHPKTGEIHTLAVRSETVQITENPDGHFLRGTVKEKSFAGGMLRIVVTLSDGNEIVISRYGIDTMNQIGQQVFLTWDSSSAVLVG